jgi:hypothetical protein
MDKRERPTSSLCNETKQSAKEPTEKMGEITGNELELVSGGNVRSQAEKRLETQRKDLIRNWGG